MTRKQLHAAINWIIKGTIAAFLLFTLYREVVGREDAAALWMAWKQQLHRGQWQWLFGVLLLLPANWSLESQKWRYLLRPFWRVPFVQAFRTVMIGVSVSLITPNRVGEYAGRVLAVPARHNYHAVLAMLAGSYAQLLAILSIGIIGASYFMDTLLDGYQLMNLKGWWLAYPAVGMLFIGFFNMSRLTEVFRKLPLPRSILRVVLMLRQYNRWQLAVALGLALARYAVYSLQYYGLILFFGIEAPPTAAFAGIATIFLIQTSVPLPPALALLVRGEAALLVWEPYSSNSWGILAATFGLFIINLCLPALLGVVFFVKTNVLKSLGYEKNIVQDEPLQRLADLSHGFRATRKKGPTHGGSRRPRGSGESLFDRQ